MTQCKSIFVNGMSTGLGLVTDKNIIAFHCL